MKWNHNWTIFHGWNQNVDDNFTSILISSWNIIHKSYESNLIHSSIWTFDIPWMFIHKIYIGFNGWCKLDKLFQWWNKTLRHTPWMILILFSNNKKFHPIASFIHSFINYEIFQLVGPYCMYLTIKSLHLNIIHTWTSVFFDSARY